MIRNYLKVAVRYLVRYKGYTAINILGLAVGITCCVLIMLFVRSEWSYDQFHSKADRIYRMWQHEKYQGQDFINTVTPIPMAPAIQSAFPEVENTCRVYAFEPIVKPGETSFTEPARMVDPSFFKMFDFNIIEGNKNNPFPTSNSVLITPRIAKKYFGKDEPIGKNIEMAVGDEKVIFTVAGIVEESPENSSIRYNLLIPFSNSTKMFSDRAHRNWFNIFLETYVLVKENASIDALQKKFPAMLKQNIGEDYTDEGFKVFMQPITAIHLDNTLPGGIEPVSNPKYSYILATIGILILLVACVNFITLSIGRSTTRALEVGVRKALGAARHQLVRQFWGEAFIVTCISVLIGIGLSQALLGPFNQLINRELVMRVDWLFISFCVGLVGLIALTAGVYPAIVLSGFKPIEVLKGKLSVRSGSGWLRQTLIVGQFVASIGMIVCTLVIGEQMRFIRTTDLGFNKDQVVVVQTNLGREDGIKVAELYRTELLKLPQVSEATTSLYSMSESPWIQLGFTDDKKVYREFQYNMIDPHFLPAMKIKMASGRNFEVNSLADKQSVIVNEAFVRDFGLTDPVGKKMPGNYDLRIVGVVKDFHYQSLHSAIRPLAMTIDPDSIMRKSENMGIALPPQPRISVRMKGGDMTANISALQEVWKKIRPAQDFAYGFLDESMAAQYRQEQRTATIVKLASALSIFIACLGLFGLATLTVAKRTKEIGIRKVLGARVSTIIRMVSVDFVKLVVIASLIAFPVAWYAMKNWLSDFAYRTNMSWWIFVVAGLGAVLIALVTVGLQAMKAAASNPVKALRTE